MKKLGSFRTINARFFNNHPKVFFLVGFLSLILAIFSIFVSVVSFFNRDNIPGFVAGISFLMFFVVHLAWGYASEDMDFLPDKVIKRAEELIKERPKWAGALRPIILDINATGDMVGSKEVVDKYYSLFLMEEELKKVWEKYAGDIDVRQERIISLKGELGLAS